MKGIAFGLFQRTLGRRYGDEAWEKLLEAAVGTGEDLPSDALAAWYGRETVRLVASARPGLFVAHGGARAFLRDLGRSGPVPLVSDEGGPSPVDALPAPDGGVLLSIRPPAGPCAFLEGVVAGLAEHYGERARVRRLKCSRDGDNRCLLSVRFGPPLLRQSERDRRRAEERALPT